MWRKCSSRQLDHYLLKLKQVHTFIQQEDLYMHKMDTIGELDPERMGSGIQFGDRSLRKHTTERRPQKQSDCSC